MAFFQPNGSDTKYDDTRCCLTNLGYRFSDRYNGGPSRGAGPLNRGHSTTLRLDLAPRSSAADGCPPGVGESYGDVVKRVLLTGMSGTGKSTLIGELVRADTRPSIWTTTSGPSGSRSISSVTPQHLGHPWNLAGTGYGEKTAFKTSYPPKTSTCCS